MPYVNIKPPKLQGSIAKIVGKAQGKIGELAVRQVAPITRNLREKGCQTLSKLNRDDSKINGVNRAIARADRRIQRFRRLPARLRRPVNRFKQIIELIKLLPIPQSVPPGFGLPISITTKYADLLHLMKEKVVQVEELTEAIDAVLSTPEASLNSLKRILNRANTGVLNCKVQLKLQEEIDKGNLNIRELKSIGIVDEEEIFIFSKLLPQFIGNTTVDLEGNEVDSRNLRQKREDQNQLLDILGRKPESADGQDGLAGGQDGLVDVQDELLNILQKTLDTLQGSNIDQGVKDDLTRLLDSIKLLSDSERNDRENLGEFSFRAANGNIYILQIINDPNSPGIAPRKFAVALDPIERVPVLKGPPSFATDTTVLLDEIKFRLNNQLP